MPNGQPAPPQMVEVPGIGLLYIKSMLKLVILILAAVEFVNIHPLIALIVLLAGYFTMPTSYYTNQPYRGMEGWLRMFIGVVIAFMLWFLLSGRPLAMIIPLLLGGPFAWLGMIFMDLLAGQPAISIFFLMLGFFVTAPERKDVTSGPIIQVAIGKRLTKAVKFASGAATGFGEKLLFLVLAGIGGALPLLQGWVSGAFSLIFGLIWLLSLAMGFFAGREGRPYVGIIIMLFAVLAFSYQFTGTVGTAMFGAWWPQVQSGITAIAAPMGEAWDSVSLTLSDTKLMLTCPSCYYAVQQQRQMAAATRVTEGGTVKSLELTKFFAINYNTDNPNIDPTIPLIGSVQLENQGTFTANGVTVTMGTPWLKNPQEFSLANKNQGVYNLPDSCVLTTCTGSETDTSTPQQTCTWTTEPFSTIRPNSKLLMNFKCGDDTKDFSQWKAGCGECKGSGCNINMCECHDPDTGETTQECINNNGDCKQSCGTDLKVVSKGNWMVEIPFTYEFGYNANVSIPVEIMNKSVFERKLLTDELNLQRAESRYSGGPIKVAIGMQQMPLRDGDESYGSFAITNTGKGKVTLADLELYFPESLTGLKLASPPKNVSMAQILQMYEIKYNYQLPGDTSGIRYTVYRLSLIGPLEQDKTAMYTFSLIYDITDKTVETKTLAIFGTVSYKYEVTDDIELPVAQATMG